MNNLNDSSCDMLTFYLLDELSDDEATLFKEHIKTCDKCRAELDDLMDIHDKFISVGDGDMVILPADLKTKTLQKAFAARPPIELRQKKRPWRLNRRLLSVVAASTFVIGIILGRISTTTQLPPRVTAAAPAQMLNEINLLPLGDTQASGMAMEYQQDNNTHLVVYVQHMQPLSTYGCYSLWDVVDGHRRNMGDFTVDQHGDAVISVSGANVSSLEITLEPAWNDPKPKGPTVLVPSREQA